MAGLSMREQGFLFGGLGSGLIAGYFLTRKQLETKYQQFADEQIAEMREHFRARAAQPHVEEKPDLATVVEDLGYTPQGEKITTVEATPVSIAEHIQYQNVFAEAHPPEDRGWDYEVETANRDTTQPYIIHQDEHSAGDMGYDQSSLTYFEGDDVLCDDNDNPIDDKDSMVGEENLQRFGHGSGDMNVLYVRNETLELDFMIAKSPNAYATEVHGFSEDELSHSDRSFRPTRGWSNE